MNQQFAAQSNRLLSLGSMWAAVSYSLAAATNFPSFSSISPSRLCSSAVFFRFSRSWTSCRASRELPGQDDKPATGRSRCRRKRDRFAGPVRERARPRRLCQRERRTRPDCGWCRSSCGSSSTAFLNSTFGQFWPFPGARGWPPGWSGRRRIGFQAHGLLQVLAGFRVLRLRGVDQPEEFVDFKAFRATSRTRLSSWAGGLGEVASVVLRHRCLEFAIEALAGLTACCATKHAHRARKTSDSRPTSTRVS